MKFDKRDLLLYGVTDRRWLKDKTLVTAAKEAIEGGITILQLREKDLLEEKILEEGRQIKALCQQRNIPFIINDNVDIAMALDADGVHVGQEDMLAQEVRAQIGKDKILGVSAQTVEQAILAQEMGADYLGVGAVFSTGTKTNANPVTLAMLKKICKAVTIPVIAIGGINKENISQLADSGIVGIAGVSSIFGKEDIVKETMKLKEATTQLTKIKTVLTIAGSDSSGGAGIAADLKTMLANGVYGMSAITALTAQNTQKVSGIVEVTPEFLALQLEAVFSDIVPDSVKIGMISSPSLMEVVREVLQKYKPAHVVLDPVMVATSGATLIPAEAISYLEEKLFPLATLITPNIPETQLLFKRAIYTPKDMEEAANTLSKQYGCAVLCKGGHQRNEANDVLAHKNQSSWYYGKRVNNKNTHGTGCTLSSAIASNLAKNLSLEQSIVEAKNYLSTILTSTLDLGQGSGPLDHGFIFR